MNGKTGHLSSAMEWWRRVGCSQASFVFLFLPLRCHNSDKDDLKKSHRSAEVSLYCFKIPVSEMTRSGAKITVT